MRRRCAWRADHDRRREGRVDAGAVHRRHRGWATAVPHSTYPLENHALAKWIYLALRRNELITTRTMEQFYDPVKDMFLPDRYVKSECPKCDAEVQYGDSCEVCGAV